MAALSAVDPKGVGVVDHDGVNGAHAHGLAGRRGDEARVEASSVGVLRDRLAGLVEGRLGRGVVSSKELELHHVAYRGLDVVGFICEAVVDGHLDDVDFLLGCESTSWLVS